MTCRFCNDTGRALYFTEIGWAQEWRDCHVCRKPEPPSKNTDDEDARSPEGKET